MLRGEKYIAPAAAAITLAVGATASGGSNVCESQFQVSREYPRDAQPDGVKIETALAQNVSRVEVGFTDPGGNWHDAWVNTKGANSIAMSVGPGAVRFRIRVKADAGAAVCEVAPDSKFIQEPYQEAINQGALVPNPSDFRLDEHH